MEENVYDIKYYSSSYKQEWDNFVRNSRNGTFLFIRDYMEYHADRFQDCSLMISLNGKLFALLPACLFDKTFSSHQGLTYGGIITDKRMTAARMLSIFDSITNFLRDKGMEKWIYAPIPYIYASYPSEEDLYALFRHNAVLKQRKISTVIPSYDTWPFSTLRKRKIKYALRSEFTIRQAEDFTCFWSILEKNLKDRHHTVPVHSLKEISLLKQRFPDNILLYCVYDKEDHIMAGTVLYLTNQVVHAQYISSTQKGRENGALDFLFHYLIHEKYKDVPYFDMGTSVEDGGRFLNEGLIFQKEGFGGRAVVYDVYEISL